MASTTDEVRKWLAGIGGGVCYPDNVKIYAPTCKGKCLREVNELTDTVSRLFGGSTVYPAAGAWIDESTGKMDTEPVRVIEAAHNCTDPAVARELGKAIVKYATRTRQKWLAVRAGKFYMGPQQEFIRRFVRR